MNHKFINYSYHNRETHTWLSSILHKRLIKISYIMNLVTHNFHIWQQERTIILFRYSKTKERTIFLFLLIAYILGFPLESHHFQNFSENLEKTRENVSYQRRRNLSRISCLLVASKQDWNRWFKNQNRSKPGIYQEWDFSKN